MHHGVFVRVLAPSLAAALALLSWAEPARAQGRGMMSMPANPAMMMSGGASMMRPPMSMPNFRTALLLNALRQREAFFLASLRQVEAQMAALEMRPASATRNALLTALQQRQTALTLALRQLAQQIAALQG
ncbi:MAG TPA: hypothetical protein VGF55_15970 [Gemmataceae bacterium]|jgi:hypothetical protein